MALSYATPGVYIEEQPSGSMPIEGVGTAVAAFVGFTERYDSEQGDPTDPDGVKPQLVTSWPQYERIYGGFVRGAMLPHAVRGYFENGGGQAYICPHRPEAATATAAVPELTAAEPSRTPSLTVLAADDTAGRTRSRWSRRRPLPRASATSTDFTLRVYEDGELREELGGLNFGGRSARTVEKTVNDRSKFIRIEVQPPQGVALAERTPAAGRYALAQTPPVSSKSVTPGDLVGNESDRTGYQGLAIAENVTMVAIPDLITVATRPTAPSTRRCSSARRRSSIDFCEASAQQDGHPRHPARAERDPRPGVAVPPGPRLGVRRRSTTRTWWSEPARPARRHQRRALLTVPPCGHVAGVWARTDAARGVWKAPANEAVRGIVGLETDVTNGEQDLLNPRASTASARSAATAPRSGAPARSRRPTRAGATSTSAGCSTSSRSRSSAAPSGPSSSPTTTTCGSGSSATSPRSCAVCGGRARWSAPPPSRRST